MAAASGWGKGKRASSSTVWGRRDGSNQTSCDTRAGVHTAVAAQQPSMQDEKNDKESESKSLASGSGSNYTYQARQSPPSQLLLPCCGCV